MTKSLIYKMRKYKNITRKELSYLTNIKDYRLRTLENNTEDISKKELYTISNALDCPIFDLLDLSELDKPMLEDLKKRIDNILKTK